MNTDNIPPIESVWTSAKEEFSNRVGTGYGCMLLGLVLAHPLHDDILARFHALPGAWIYGVPCSGKTQLGATIAALYGAPHSPFFSERVTDEALRRILGTPHSSPVHLDNFQNQSASVARIALLRQAFNRTPHIKGNSAKDMTVSQPQHPPLITGEGRCSDSATASRYLHFSTGGSRLNPTDRQWQELEAARKLFPLVTRQLLEHRDTWLKLTICSIESILDSLHPSGIHDRTRLAASIAAGVFIAADYILSGADMTAGEHDALSWLREHIDQL